MNYGKHQPSETVKQVVQGYLDAMKAEESEVERDLFWGEKTEEVRKQAERTFWQVKRQIFPGASR